MKCVSVRNLQCEMCVCREFAVGNVCLWEICSWKCVSVGNLQLGMFVCGICSGKCLSAGNLQLGMCVECAMGKVCLCGICSGKLCVCSLQWEMFVGNFQWEMQGGRGGICSRKCLSVGNLQLGMCVGGEFAVGNVGL